MHETAEVTSGGENTVREASTTREKVRNQRGVIISAEHNNR